MSLVHDLTQLALPVEGADPSTYEAALNQAASQQRSLVGTLLEEGLVDEHRFLMHLSTWLGVPWWNDQAIMPTELRDAFPARLALRYHLLPVKVDESGLWILTYDPFNLLARQAVTQSVSQNIVWVMSTRKQILDGLRQGYGIGAETFEQILEGREIDDDAIDLKQEVNILDQDDSEASVVKFVNQILKEALEPLRRILQRFRIRPRHFRSRGVGHDGADVHHRGRDLLDQIGEIRRTDPRRSAVAGSKGQQDSNSGQPHDTGGKAHERTPAGGTTYRSAVDFKGNSRKIQTFRPLAITSKCPQTLLCLGLRRDIVDCGGVDPTAARTKFCANPH